MREGVVLLHGIGANRFTLWAHERFFRRRGYDVLNLTYPSTRFELAGIVDAVAPSIAAFAARVERVHFVGHSMGGLVIRGLLARHRPANLGRVVMMGTPNNGSELADRFRDWRLYRRVFGPAGQQLMTGFIQAFPDASDYSLGVLAGDRGLNVIGRKLIGRPSDGMVAIESTKLAGMADHRVLPIGHTAFMVSREAMRQTLHFLREGKFT